MKIESAKWLNQQDLEEYSFIQQFIQQSFSSESYSSYPPMAAAALSSSSVETATHRPTKLQKTASWGSTVTADHHSPKLPPSPTSQILSFEGKVPASQQLYVNLNPAEIKPVKDEAVSPTGVMNFQPLISSKGSKRTHSMIKTPSPQDHIIAERKRREKLSQRFIALSALVPGLKKMDKATVLGDAIKHIKQMQEKVKELEEQTRKRTVESVVLVKKSLVSADDDDVEGSSLSDGNSRLPEIEARVSEKDVLIRIHCHKQQGLVAKILDEIEKLHLSIVSSSALPFGNSTLDITVIAQMNDEFSMAVKDLVKHLRNSLM